MGVTENTLKGTAERFVAFHKEFSRFFQTKTRHNSEIAGQYLSGLVQANKRNMERMEEKVPESNEQALQHFITNSPWDEKAALRQVALEGDKLLGGTGNTCLLIDETCFEKKGKKSVGVARQYNGRVGNVDNCQVAVFGALVANKKSLPIDFRLYLPKDWTDDKVRCLEAGIPEEQIELKSKCKLAIEIVKTARQNGVRFNWVGADAGYGKDPGFIGDLFALGENFVVDVQKNQRVSLVQTPPNGIPRTISVQLLAMAQPDEAWITHSAGDGTKGPLVFEYIVVDAWVRAAHYREHRQVQVVIRRLVADKSDIKYSIAHFEAPITPERLAFTQGQRYWIERVFEDAKGGLGMAEYQMRKWRGWHHHMALICMAHLFLLRERIHNEEAYPLLSIPDIVTMLAFYLPKRDVNEEEIFRQLDARHRKRQREIDRGKAGS